MIEDIALQVNIKDKAAIVVLLPNGVYKEY